MHFKPIKRLLNALKELYNVEALKIHRKNFAADDQNWIMSQMG